MTNQHTDAEGCERSDPEAASESSRAKSSIKTTRGDVERLIEELRDWPQEINPAGNIIAAQRIMKRAADALQALTVENGETKERLSLASHGWNCADQSLAEAVARLGELEALTERVFNSPVGAAMGRHDDYEFWNPLGYYEARKRTDDLASRLLSSPEGEEIKDLARDRCSATDTEATPTETEADKYKALPLVDGLDELIAFFNSPLGSAMGHRGDWELWPTCKTAAYFLREMAEILVGAEDILDDLTLGDDEKVDGLLVRVRAVIPASQLLSVVPLPPEGH